MKSFSHYLNERIALLQQMSMPATTLAIATSFTLITQFHIFHLLTRSHAEHEAIGEFYKGLGEPLDCLAEAFIGLGGAIKVPHTQGPTTDYSPGTVIRLLNLYRASISDALAETNSPQLQSLNDHLVTIQKLVDSLLYKLGLN
jgi:hypothetical protein